MSIQKIETCAGVDSSIVNGSFIFYADSERTNALSDEDINQLVADETLTIYYTYIPDGTNTNHSSDARNGSIVLTVVPIVIGDLNGDARITVIDADLLLDALNGLVTLTADEIKNADVNGDGKLTGSDITLIYRRAAGLDSKFPVE
jgi:hypothetical protein